MLFQAVKHYLHHNVQTGSGDHTASFLSNGYSCYILMDKEAGTLSPSSADVNP
jgi:hypothetical protein